MSIESVVTAYGEAWNEPDAARRRALLEKAWTDDGVYCDPTARVEGRESLVAHIAGYQEQFADARIEVRSRVDQHGQNFRFAWAIVDSAEHVVLEGVDFGQVADDGRIRSITGFFGPLA
jgi:hypothetical protein